MYEKNKLERIVTRKDIAKVVSKMAKIPLENIIFSRSKQAQHLENKLKKHIFGQDHALKTLCNSIKLARCGLREQEKPIGCFLFSGPTGVGKTETAKQLAYSLGVPLHRFDMSEYTERHALSRLIGAPPGYVGFEQEGLLTKVIRQTPHCVLLLDEIEKAHPDLYNLMLQVMDYGKLTDNNGLTAYFHHVVLIMTTNAGASLLGKSSYGFTEKNHKSDHLQAIHDIFSAEFRNRLDAILPFHNLNQDTVYHIVDKLMLNLSQQLKQQNIKIKISPIAKKWLAQNGYDANMGARPMMRLLSETVKQPLAEKILSGQLKNGTSIFINLKKQKLVLEKKRSFA